MLLNDYLEAEDLSKVRHEFVRGAPRAMKDDTLRHNRVTMNVARLIADRIEGTQSQSFALSVKLHVQAADSVYYPDVIVHCGSAVADDTRMLQDAALVIEVLSDSTMETDRREKLVAYRKMPGLRGYWIVSQAEQRVEVHERDATGLWQATAYGPGEALPAGWLGGAPLALARIYAGTDIA